MPPQFVAATSAQAASSATRTTTRPTGTVAGHAQLLAVVVTGDRTVSTPAGWTPGPNVTNGTSLRLALFVRPATGTTDDVPTVTQSTAGPIAVGLVTVSGADAVSVLDVTGTASALTCPQVAAFTDDCLGLYIAGWRAAATRTSTAPVGYTERVDVSTTTGTVRVGLTIATADTPVNTGTVGTAAATLSGASVAALSASVVVRPPRPPTSLATSVRTAGLAALPGVPERDYLADDTARQAWLDDLMVRAEAARQTRADSYMQAKWARHRAALAAAVDAPTLANVDAYVGI